MISRLYYKKIIKIDSELGVVASKIADNAQKGLYPEHKLDQIEACILTIMTTQAILRESIHSESNIYIATQIKAGQDMLKSMSKLLIKEDE